MGDAVRNDVYFCFWQFVGVAQNFRSFVGHDDEAIAPAGQFFP